MGKMWKLSDFIFLGSKINANSDCSHEIKRHWIIWKKSYDKTSQCIKKHFADKGSYSQNYGFLVVKHGCESWTIKKAECWTFDAFNCGAGEDSWESLGQQRDQASQS